MRTNVKRSTIKELSIWFGVIACLTISWAYFANGQRVKMVPKTGTTFDTFVEDMPPPKRLAQVEDGSGKKIVWVGETALLSLPSGPSCYVFDDTGKLIRYNISTGDGEPTTKDLVIAYRADQITIEEAKTLLNLEK